MAVMIGDGKGDSKPKPRPVGKYNNRKANAINNGDRGGEYFLIQMSYKFKESYDI